MNTYPKLFVVTDIETDGPHIGMNSMRSIASVAVCPATLNIVSRFSINIMPLMNGVENPNTVENFFKKQFPNAWADLNQNPKPPPLAMSKYHLWLQSLNCQDLWFVADPISFDKSWTNWYLKTFCSPSLNGSVFNIRDFDTRSWETGLLGADPSEADMLVYPSEWHSPLPHTHIAREDAEKAADELIRRLKWLNKRLNAYTKIP